MFLKGFKKGRREQPAYKLNIDQLVLLCIKNKLKLKLKYLRDLKT